MAEVVTLADKRAIEDAMPWAARAPATTLYEFICRAADRFPDRPAVSFQLTSGPGDAAETLSWAELRAEVTRTANMLRALGVGEGDTVAYLLPNATETVLTLLGGAVAGIVNPVNPLLEAEQIGGILKATNAKVLVTLKSMPKTDVAQKAAEALKLAPNVETVIEVDLKRYLKPPKSWIVSLIRPKMPRDRPQRVVDFSAEKARHRSDALDFPDATGDRVAAYFHTGGTTGLPKVAQHRYSGLSSITAGGAGTAVHRKRRADVSVAAVSCLRRLSDHDVGRSPPARMWCFRPRRAIAATACSTISGS
jgi:acyl-CoA synthetase (AMP-forming)/AMP-acid ligase II